MAQEVRTVDQRTPAATDSGQRTGGPRPVFVPPADIYETGDNIVVLAEMPGVAPRWGGHHPRAAGIDDPRAKRR